MKKKPSAPPKHPFNKRVLRVAITALHPNPWNPNVLNPMQEKALSESLEEFSDLDFILCRPHPDHPNQYEIVDGEHRWKDLSKKGETEIDIVVADLSDAQAKKYTIIANETRGTANKTDLGKLLTDLQNEYGEDVGKGLPYTDQEINELLALAKPARPAPKQRSTQADDAVWKTIHARVPESVYDLFVQAEKDIADRFKIDGYKLHTEADIARGQILECLVAEYLAIPNQSH